MDPVQTAPLGGVLFVKIASESFHQTIKHKTCVVIGALTVNAISSDLTLR